MFRKTELKSWICSSIKRGLNKLSKYRDSTIVDCDSPASDYSASALSGPTDLDIYG